MINHPFTIKAATTDGTTIATLADFATRCFTENFGHLYEPQALQSHLEKTCSKAFFLTALETGSRIFLARDQSTIIGYAKCGRLKLPVDAPPPDACELHRLYVAPLWQGRAVGHALMRHVLALPETRAASGVYLGVWEHNKRAQRFYARYGFAPVGEYLYYVGHHADREIIMHKRPDATP